VLHAVSYLFCAKAVYQQAVVRQLNDLLHFMLVQGDMDKKSEAEVFACF
jgi:hypothetical protein